MVTAILMERFRAQRLGTITWLSDICPSKLLPCGFFLLLQLEIVKSWQEVLSDARTRWEIAIDVGSENYGNTNVVRSTTLPVAGVLTNFNSPTVTLSRVRFAMSTQVEQSPYRFFITHQLKGSLRSIQCCCCVSPSARYFECSLIDIDHDRRTWLRHCTTCDLHSWHLVRDMHPCGLWSYDLLRRRIFKVLPN